MTLASVALRDTTDPEVFYLPLAEDTFIHFTTRRRAEQILASGKLLMNPPYAKMGTHSVDAVSTVWGWYTPNVQTKHIKRHEAAEGGLVAILFKTNTMPDVGFVEEVKWHQDVLLRKAVIIPGLRGKALLQRTPQRLTDDQQRVVWQEPKTARVIPLDKPGIQDLAKQLEQVIAKALMHREGPLGKMTLGQHKFDAQTVDGDERRVWIKLQTIPSRDFRYVVGGGVGTAKGQHVVVININGSLPAEVIWKAAHARTMHGFLYPVLLHELTHVADKFAPGHGERHTEQGLRDDPGTYHNNSSELRAFMQEIVDELSSRFRHYEKLRKNFGARALEILLNMSPTWHEVSPHWTARNQQKVMKTVYQALEEWQGAQKVAARYMGVAGRVAARFIEAKASLAPAIQSLGKGQVDLDAVKEALTALDVRPNGERWFINADWFYGMGPRNQAKAKTIITSLGHLVGYPENDVESVTLKAIANGLKWLEKAKGTTPAFQHGPFEVTPLSVTGPQVQSVLGALDEASKAIRAKFPKLLYGKVYVTKTLPNSHSTVAKYMEDGDVVYISLKAKSTTGDVYALCHEFGHRYDKKFWKDKKQREEFNRLSTMPEYGQIVFDGALRKKLTDEFMGTMEDQKAGRRPQPSDMLTKWLDHHIAHNLDKLRPLSLRAVKGDEQAARELRALMLGDKDVTVQTGEIVRKPLHVTTYGAKSATENFAEAFAHHVLGMSMPAEIGAIMASL